MIFRLRAMCIKNMSAYDDRYEIRLAGYPDIEDIMDFISHNWKKDHILARDRRLFEYEFLEEDGSVNFALAIDREKSSIEAISGFLRASHDPQNLDIWGVMWMTRPNNMTLLGVELLKRRDNMVKCRTSMGVGDNPDTAIPLVQKIMHRYVAKMKQYYILADRQDYKIAVVNERKKKECADKKHKIIHFASIDELTEAYNLKKNVMHIPYKDSRYIDHRYFGHVAYTYDVCGIVHGEAVTAVIILRREQLGDRHAVRIVDYIGDQSAITGIAWYFDELLEEKGCEYIDFYNMGFEDEYLDQAGFILREPSDPNILPNYFHPFVRENIDIWVDSTDQDTCFFKGDADQDRPN